MNVYFIGIGGSGISPLANLALDCGYNIWGSDLKKGLGTNEIESRGVEVFYNQDGTDLENLIREGKIDWVVYTAAIKNDHPEIIIANKHNIKNSKRDEFINYIITKKNLKLVAIAGTHGKTTSTAMMVWVMKKLGLPVSYLIGSQTGFGRSSEYIKGSKYFILEMDEFDRNFLRYKPELAIVTNIDFDHPDIYKDEEDYNDSFSEFLNLVKSHKLLWSQDSKKVLSKDLEVYSKTDDNVISQIHKINLLGKHNRENAFLVFKLMKKLFDFDDQTIMENLSTFPGTTRRMEKIYDNLYSDYAHHPTEIAATIQLASELEQEIVVVYEPHQNVRQHQVKENYRDCFNGVKKVYWLPTFLSREDPALKTLSQQDLIEYVDDKISVETADLNSDLKQKIDAYLTEGAIVVSMGAGSLDKWVRENYINQ